MRVTSRRYDDPVAVLLRADLMVDLAERYGGDGDQTPVDAAEFRPPSGDFLVAWLDGRPAGCVGWRSRGSADAELKRMWVTQEFRGRGVAKALLQAVEDSARAAGRTRMVLETGTEQPEAIGLYVAAGYTPIPGFGHYAGSPQERSFARDL
jgi:GNAT superfamily N-acetyltransferase